MQKKFIFVLLLLSVSLLLYGCNKPAADPVVPEDIGNKAAQCPNSPDFKWCKSLDRCAKITEEVCPDDYKGENVEIARLEVLNLPIYKEEGGRDLKVQRVIEAKCTECLIIDFEFYNEKNEKKIVRVSLDSFDYREVNVVPAGTITLTPEECTAKGGRIVMPNKDKCADDEKQIGEVYEFIAPNICCAK